MISMVERFELGRNIEMAVFSGCACRLEDGLQVNWIAFQ